MNGCQSCSFHTLYFSDTFSIKHNMISDHSWSSTSYKEIENMESESELINHIFGHSAALKKEVKYL